MRKRIIVPIAIIGIILITLVYIGYKGNIDYKNNNDIQDTSLKQTSNTDSVAHETRGHETRGQVPCPSEWAKVHDLKLYRV